jgi:hypothetical protein
MKQSLGSYVEAMVDLDTRSKQQDITKYYVMITFKYGIEWDLRVMQKVIRTAIEDQQDEKRRSEMVRDPMGIVMLWAHIH